MKTKKAKLKVKKVLPSYDETMQREKALEALREEARRFNICLDGMETEQEIKVAMLEQQRTNRKADIQSLPQKEFEPVDSYWLDFDKVNEQKPLNNLGFVFGTCKNGNKFCSIFDVTYKPDAKYLDERSMFKFFGNDLDVISRVDKLSSKKVIMYSSYDGVTLNIQRELGVVSVYMNGTKIFDIVGCENYRTFDEKYKYIALRDIERVSFKL